MCYLCAQVTLTFQPHMGRTHQSELGEDLAVGQLTEAS